MYGRDMGTLNIYLRTNIGGYKTLLFTKNWYSNDYWELASLALLDEGSSNFQVVIEVVRGDGPYGDIGIDDTSFTTDCMQVTGGLPSGTTTPAVTTIGPCGKGRWQCDDLTCIDSSQYCDYQEDCPDKSDEAFCGPCMFESGLCGWYDESYGQYVWEQKQAGTDQIPDKDHTLDSSSGYYVKVVPGNGQFSEFSRLYSPMLPHTAVECILDFWFFYQESSKNVEFKLEVKVGDDPSFTIWSPLYTWTSSWMKAHVGIGRLESSYQLIFAALVEYENDTIAIDDITFTDCKAVSYVPCEILCDNKLCVPYSAECDYSQDCGDGTDENTCSAYWMCDFESGTVCDWTQNYDDELNWFWLTGYQGSLDGAPYEDHTHGSPTGHYFYLDSGEDDVNKKALLDGLVFSKPQSPGDCQIRFWTFMNGANVNRLSVLTQVSTHDDPERAWTQDKSLGDLWNKFSVPLDIGYRFKVYFEGIAGGLDDNIAIDDITMTPGCIKDPDQTLPVTVTPTDSPHCSVGQRACNDGTCIDSEKFCNFIYDCDDASDEIDCPSACDFDLDMCMWRQGVNDNFDWSRFNNSEADSYAGPISDHSTGSPRGIYYYVDGLTSSKNHHATLISPTYGQAGTDCIASVWYYIYGSSYGNLEIKRRVDGEERTLMAINEGNVVSEEWTQARISLPPCLSNFNILIEAGNKQSITASGGYAIDDIRFDHCAFAEYDQSCPTNFYQCGDQHCYHQDHKCDLNKDCCTDDGKGNDENNCGSYNQCDFEGDLCSSIWSHLAAPEDDFDWTRIQALKMSQITFDHTTDTENGYYMYMDPQNRAQSGDKTQLGSYIIQASNTNCKMRFFYYMTGINGGTLNVYTRTMVGGPLLLRWTDAVDRGLMWMKEVITLNSDDMFQVIIEGVKGQGSTGILAIDDTTFTPECRVSGSSLPVLTTGVPTTTVPTTSTKPSSKPSSSSPSQTDVITTTAQPTKQQGTHSPLKGGINTGLVAGLSATAAIIILIILISGLFWQRGRRRDIDHVLRRVLEFEVAGQRGRGDRRRHEEVSGGGEKEGYCDFEHGDLCGFDQDYNDQGDWNVEPNGFSSLALTYGPDTDHTYGTNIGHFIYVDSINNNYMSKVRLISPVYPSTFQQCLQLWVFSMGTDAPDFTATVTVGDTPLTQILSIDDSNSRGMWIPYEASFSSSLDYTIIFEATIGSDGVLALDDINLNKDYCAPPGSCDFEYDTCTFYNYPSSVSNDQFDWLRASGPTPSQSSGPNADHSTGTAAGFYMYIDSAPPRQTGDSAILNFPFLNGEKCVSFWYYMGGADGSLDVRTVPSLWSKTGPLDNTWMHATVTVTTDDVDKTYSVSLIGTLGTLSQSDIAVDDISVYDGPCAGATNPPPCQFYCDNGACLKDATLVCNFNDDCGDSSDEVNCGSCDFESGWCNYTDNSIGSLEWLRGQGSKHAVDSGPSKDHTIGTSEVVGSVHFLLVSGLDRSFVSYYSKVGSGEWSFVSIPIGRVKGTFQIEVKAFRDYAGKGDIAIDDISFRDCSFPAPPPGGCSPVEFTCGNGNCINTDRYCDLTDDCGDMSDEINCDDCGDMSDKNDCDECRDMSDENDCDNYESCDFQTGICKWTQLRTDEVDWRRWKGLTRSVGTGPGRDHTTGLDSGYQRSSTFTPDKAINGPLTRIWTRSGDIGEYFLRADIELKDISSPIQVIIEAVGGDGEFGDIAIDDTSFTQGCIFGSNLWTDSYQCNNGTCLDVDQRCDGKMDCGESEDETDCGNCDFESDECGWTGIPNGLYLWTRIQASSAPSGRGPSLDHTLNSGTGYYMFVDSTFGTFGMTALLLSPLVLGSTGSRCEMEFYYHMRGDAGTLTCILYVDNLPDASWSMSGDQGTTWHRGSLLVGPRFAGQYYVRLEASPGVGFDNTQTPTDIAVDDINFINCDQSTDLTCDFGPSDSDGTFCGWTQDDGSDSLDFGLLSKPPSGTGYAGPSADHTDGTGYFAVAIAKKLPEEGDFVRLLSGALRSTDNQPSCFSFWYHMSGPGVGSLNLIQRDTDGNNEVLIWTKNGNQGNTWMLGQRNIITTSNYELVLESVCGSNWFSGDIAIDDIMFKEGACLDIVECDFELDFCDWKNLGSESDDFDWLRGTALSSQGKGPDVDHTTFTNTGYYLYVDTSMNGPRTTGILQSKDYYHTGPRCVSFYYYMSGSGPGTLSVYRQDDGDLFVSPSWTKTGDQGDRWIRAELEITPNLDKSYKIYIELTSSGISPDSSMAIDDINIDDRFCSAQGSCTFEYDMCGFDNDYQNDDADWMIGSRTTSSSFTGPAVDHTLQTAYGHYVFVESSFSDEGFKSWLLSEHFPPTGGRCLEFWYHMYGAGMGDLNVYTATKNTAPILLFTESGNHGDIWIQGQVNVDAPTTFWVIFEGVVGFNYTSDIALDDIFLHPSVCMVTMPPPTQPPPPPTALPDLHNCDFENGFCNWTQDLKDDFNWTRATGETVTPGTGPSADHTKMDQTGYYVYAELSNHQPGDPEPGDIARLNSAALKNVDKTGYCMTYWFHMYGEDIGSFTVYEKNGDVETAVWTETRTRGPHWKPAHIHFTDTGTYYIILEVVRGPNDSGDVAVDDISFHPGVCSTPDSCDFENGECFYSQTTPDQFDWAVIQANSKSIAPPIDTTYRTEYGHVFIADMTSLSSNKDVGIVDSGPIAATTGDGQCLSMSYYMVNSKYCQFKIYKVQLVSGETELLWEMDGIIHEDEWHVMEVNINNTDGYFKVRFQASSRDRTMNAAISVDDITLSTTPCQPFGSCDFETGLCTWTNEEKLDDFDWKLIQGQTPTDFTGPPADHTFGTQYGTYIYIESSDMRKNQKAILKSGDFLASEKRCLEFYYYMYGTSVGSLYVQRQADTQSKFTNLKKLSGNKGAYWRQQLVR
nr:MAM and LDL-receptor class A domain-containing protein 1-like [Lytechinus pictus]